MFSINNFLTTLFLCLFLIHGSQAENKNTPPINKSEYTLFNPLPNKYLREMTTDRPDKTENPYTIDPGHFQIEFDAITWTRDHHKKNDKNTHTKTYSIFVPNLRIGLLHNLELDIISEGYNHVTIKDLIANSTENHKGLGDSYIRLKYNFWGNEGADPTALGIIPFIKFPTNQDHLGNKYTEGGFLMPLDLTFSENLGLGLMTGISYIRADNQHKYVYLFTNTASLAYDFTETIGGYMEFSGEKSTEKKSKWNVTFDVGTTYALTENWQLDAGINIGLSKAADDFNPFIGMSVRF